MKYRTSLLPGALLRVGVAVAQTSAPAKDSIGRPADLDLESGGTRS